MAGITTNQSLKLSTDQLLNRLEGLPTLPTVAHKVSQLVNDPNSDSYEIAQAMKEDQSLTARVLTLVNSAYYSIPGGVADVKRAISYLGFNTVYQLVLTVGVFDTLRAVPGTKFNIKELWKHSLGCAILAEMIAKQVHHEKPEELFTAGLLHDIGKVALATCAHEMLDAVVDMAYLKGMSFKETELAMGVLGHDSIGRRLAEKWKLPGTVVAGIGYHHNIEPAQRMALAKPLHVVADIVAIADMLCRKNAIGNSGDDRTGEVNEDVAKRIGLSPATIARIEEELPKALERSKTFLQIVE